MAQRVDDGDSSPVEHDESDGHRKGDYINVPSRPYLMKILRKQGDQQVLFADKVLKFTGSGKMKCRILLITDFAIYIVDPETDSLKRRIALAAVDKICISKLNDNFLAVIIPTEYDLLIASARKNEIIIAFNEATLRASDYELEVVTSNSSLPVLFHRIILIPEGRLYQGLSLWSGCSVAEAIWENEVKLSRFQMLKLLMVLFSYTIPMLQGVFYLWLIHEAANSVKKATAEDQAMVCKQWTYTSLEAKTDFEECGNDRNRGE